MLKSRLPVHTPPAYQSNEDPRASISPARVASQVTSAMSDDDSIVTVDEDVSDIPAEESLNYSVLTTQLPQLRQ